MTERSKDRLKNIIDMCKCDVRPTSLTSDVSIISYFVIFCTGPRKSATTNFSVLCLQKVNNFSTSSGKVSFSEKNDTNIIEFGEVILITCPFVKIQPF